MTATTTTAAFVFGGEVKDAEALVSLDPLLRMSAGIHVLYTFLTFSHDTIFLFHYFIS